MKILLVSQCTHTSYQLIYLFRYMNALHCTSTLLLSARCILLSVLCSWCWAGDALVSCGGGGGGGGRSWADSAVVVTKVHPRDFR